MPVLDTAALLHWPVERMVGGIVAHSQLEELRRLSPQRAMLIESIDIEWMSMGTGDAESAAATTGDLPRLSPVDLDILALALATGEKLFTDDYSLQNVCRAVNHPFEAVSNKRSRQQWSWELRCIGCRATKKADSQKEEECDICGSPMKVKRSRN
ncbi:MAG: nucleic acid-binding protein [Euryarchaeota archaeon]|jgi:rRNA maturation endonuclease Nob1|nr:nucleic acid-binding protein [Euryarchaeota archaeon]NCF97091.1 nucleic acid-binding protein [Euryarchaeota archaeon]